MSPLIGWLLAAVFVALAAQAWGWPGVWLALSVIVFWLLLQFSRASRVMRAAGARPVGAIASAAMLHAKLRPGMTMLQVIALTRSLGRKLDDAGDEWAWHDAGGSRVRLRFDKGRLADILLERPGEAAGTPRGAP